MAVELDEEGPSVLRSTTSPDSSIPTATTSVVVTTLNKAMSGGAGSVLRSSMSNNNNPNSIHVVVVDRSLGSETRQQQRNQPKATTTTTTVVEGPEQRVSSSSSSSSPRDSVQEASWLGRYCCASVVLGIFAVWGKWTFGTKGIPGVTIPLHNWKVPILLNVFYLLSLPFLRLFTKEYLSKTVNVKSLLTESMLLYNVGQVLLNGWMCYAFLRALFYRGHPFIGGAPELVETGVTYAVWVHYCDKYLEYLDTYFMVLRGRIDQVSFLHVYHHTSISIAWWVALKFHPGGDVYFGALLNSFIHVLMYSYYAMTLLKIRCPWKRYLTQAQLLQFTLVVIYTFVSGTFLQNRSWRIMISYYTQCFEMISLFCLFTAFYRKAYKMKATSCERQHGNMISVKMIDSDIARVSSTNKEDFCMEDTEQVSVSSDSSLEDNNTGKKEL